MSYNIDTWKTKKLENLVIPIDAFFESESTDWHPKITISDMVTNEVELDCGCGQTIKGILKDKLLYVSKLEIYGEGSGSLMNYVLNHALEESTGELDAILIWEGGDSITRLKVINGELTEEDVEL